MGTFHHDKGELHGITVVVQAKDGKLYVGRCDVADAFHVVLLDADFHEEGGEGPSREEYLSSASKFGIWAKHPRIELASSEVESIRRLGEL